MPFDPEQTPPREPEDSELTERVRAGRNSESSSQVGPMAGAIFIPFASSTSEYRDVALDEDFNGLDNEDTFDGLWII